MYQGVTMVTMTHIKSYQSLHLQTENSFMWHGICEIKHWIDGRTTGTKVLLR